GEVRVWQHGPPRRGIGGDTIIAAIEPMHGNHVVVYRWQHWSRLPWNWREPVVLDGSLNQGHGLGIADFLDIDRPQIVAGWRDPNAAGKVGILLYVPNDGKGDTWTTHTLTNAIACE